jgi:hypothetical protein
MNETDRRLYSDLVRRLAAMDNTQYANLAELHADMQSPLYGTDEAFTELVERKLAASKHLYEQNPSGHRVSDVRGGDSVHVTASIDNDGNVTAQETHAGYTGQSTPDPLSDDFNEGDATEIVQTESSVIVKVRG